MFEQRRIEAMILKHVYDTLKASHGVEVAQKAIADAVRASSIEQARMFAAKVGGKTSIQTFKFTQHIIKDNSIIRVKEENKISKEETDLHFFISFLLSSYFWIIFIYQNKRIKTMTKIIWNFY